MRNYCKTKYFTLWGVVILLVLFTFSSLSFAQGGTWETKAPMPTPVGQITAGVIDGKLYVPGVDPRTLASVLYVYDQATDTWNIGSASPTPRNGTAGVISGKLYVVGGCINLDCRIGTTNLLEVYDPVADSWTTLTPMPTARSGAAASVVNDILYVVGGRFELNNNLPLATLEAYDPAFDTWTTLAPMPTPISHFTAAAIGGKLYVVGGAVRVDTTLMSTGILLVYDPAMNTWDTSNAPMPTDRVTHAGGVINGILYVVGGNNSISGILATVEAYDPVTDTWSTMDPMPTARWGIGAGVIDGKLYVAGGAGADPSGPSGANLDTLEVFTPVVSVDIDIKPGSDPNSINLSSAGVIPVAILSSDTFDATTVDPDSLTIAGASVRVVGKGSKLLSHKEDVNGDGLLDLVCQFENLTDFLTVEGESGAVLEGFTFDGTPIRGEDHVRIVRD